ncbi:glycosyltransferase family 39 protein [Streptacidiphilus sp. MAP12-16]|uniref:glycosyltransferase family 39 protein n=1 Tax=Streptacidiphilus sp. MAP12-16 TaxID=3156300 RepID=UPI003519630D
MSTTSYAGHSEPSDLAPLVQGSASSDSRSSLIQRLLCSVWLWPMVLTLALGLYKISKPELWRDELASWSAASRSVPQLFRLLGHVDTSSGAYYLFLHFWIKIFGDSIVALRLPSVLAMAGAAGCVALLGRRMFSTSAGVLAGLAFAVMPAVSRYAQEARSYAFTILGVTVATMLLLRALEKPQARRWTAYAVCVAATGAMSLVSLVLLPVHALVVFLEWRSRRDQRALWGFPLACGVALLPLLPLALAASKQASEQISWVSAPTVKDLRAIWPLLMDSYVVAYALAATLVALIGAALVRRVDRRQAAIAGALAVLPVLLVWLVSQGGQSYWLARYLLIVLPAWAIIVGATLAALGRTAGVCGLVALALLALPDQAGVRTPGSHDRWDYPHVPATPWLDYSGTADIIQANYEPGDGLAPLPSIHFPLMWDLGLRYHLPPGELGMRTVLKQQTPIKAAQLSETDTAHPAGGIGKEPRLWLETLTNPAGIYFYFPPDMAAALQAHYRLERTWHPANGTTVALLVRTSPSQ